MARPFGTEYAQIYDIIYADKDYKKEAGYVARLVGKFSQRPVRSIVDISAGTGGHALELSKRGYEVVGLDISESMIDLARTKAAKHKSKVKFIVASMQDFAIGRKFDAAISMFDSICYLSGPKDVTKALFHVKRSLKEEGVFLLQYWNGDAVTNQKPSYSYRVCSIGDMTVARSGQPRLVQAKQFCYMNYSIVVKRRGVPDLKFDEIHRMRYYFPDEMKKLLKLAGFSQRGVFRLGSIDPATSRDWSVCSAAVSD